MIPDRFFYPLAALVVAGLIALAAVYPQGEGTRSPGRFGHPMAAPVVPVAAAPTPPPLPAALSANDGAKVRTGPLP